MSTKENFLPKTQIVSENNISAGLKRYSWRGTEHRKFNLQIRTRNVTVKIYSSLKKTPGRTGWVDMTDYFTGAATITTSQMLQQTSDVKALWWGLTWIRASANNSIVIELLEYDRDKVE